MSANHPPVLDLGFQKRQVLADHVFEAVLSMLLDGEVATGSALSIDGLAKRFGVSSTPVREALARLESTGMVHREALRGYRVAPAPSIADVQDLLVTRQVLEPAMASLACRNANADFIAQLRLVNEEMDRSRKGGETFAGYRSYWKADELFHRHVAEAAGNEFLLRAYGAVEGHIQRFRLLAHNNEIDGEHAVKEHRAIVDAFAAGDSTAAKKAMIAHLKGIKSRTVCPNALGDNS